MIRWQRKKPKGTLVLIGGNVDKSRKKLVLRRMVEKTEAGPAVIIPTASSDRPRSVGRAYRRVLADLGVAKSETLDVVRRSSVDRPKNLAAIDQANLIFFTGGDQVKLVRAFEGTELLTRIHQRYAEGATLAGTSAGAHVAGDSMIFDGNRQGFCKGTVGTDAGFGFLTGVTIDTHFWTRRRLARLSQLLASGRSDLGIGLAENTAIVVEPNGCFEVVGSGMVTVLNSRNMRYTDYEKVARNRPVTTDGLSLSFLAPGTIYNLKERTVVSSGLVPAGNGSA